MVSKKFIVAVKMADRPAYKIAQEAGTHPVIISRLIRKIDDAKPGNPTVLRIAKVLGLRPQDCFEK